MKSYTELEVWKKARALTLLIYAITKTFPNEEQYCLTTQIRRCAISVPSNIAEGCGRSTSKDTMHFLFIARGSLYEMETQLLLSFDLGYITEETLNSTLASITDCKMLINGFINYHERKV